MKDQTAAILHKHLGLSGEQAAELAGKLHLGHQARVVKLGNYPAAVVAPILRKMLGDLPADVTQAPPADHAVLPLTIPKRLHRVWVGPQHRPPLYDAWWLRWGQLHPDWDRFTWGDLDIQDWEVAPLFPRCSHWAIVSDLVRIEAVWRFGGVYVDCDTEPLRPIDELLVVPGRLTLMEPAICHPNSVWNCAFMAPPRSPLLREVLNRFLVIEGSLTCTTAGPGGMAWLIGHPDVRWIPHRYFSPWRVHHREAIANDSFALHHFCAAWNEK